MLGLSKKKGPTRPFSHAQDCKILKADPASRFPWQEIETGHWVAECQCGKEHHHEAPAVPLLLADPVSTFQPGEWRSMNLAVPGSGDGRNAHQGIVAGGPWGFSCAVRDLSLLDGISHA